MMKAMTMSMMRMVMMRRWKTLLWKEDPSFGTSFPLIQHASHIVWLFFVVFCCCCCHWHAVIVIIIVFFFFFVVVIVSVVICHPLLFTVAPPWLIPITSSSITNGRGCHCGCFFIFPCSLIEKEIRVSFFFHLEFILDGIEFYQVAVHLLELIVCDNKQQNLFFWLIHLTTC